MAQPALSRNANPFRITPPIDLVQLATNTLGNRDLELQVLQMFVSQSTSMMTRLLAEEDRDAGGRLVHTLKGSARAIGATMVAQECERLEHHILAGDDVCFSRLTGLVEEANGYIGDLIED